MENRVFAELTSSEFIGKLTKYVEHVFTPMHDPSSELGQFITKLAGEEGVKRGSGVIDFTDKLDNKELVTHATTSTYVFTSYVVDELPWGRRFLDVMAERLPVILRSPIAEERNAIFVGRNRFLVSLDRHPDEENMHEISHNEAVRMLAQHEACSEKRRGLGTFITYTQLVACPCPETMDPEEYAEVRDRLLLCFNVRVYAHLIALIANNMKNLNERDFSKGDYHERPAMFANNFRADNSGCSCHLCMLSRQRPSIGAAEHLLSPDFPAGDLIKAGYIGAQLEALAFIFNVGQQFISRYFETSTVAIVADTLREQLTATELAMLQRIINQHIGATQVLTREETLEIASDPEKWKAYTEQTSIQHFHQSRLLGRIANLLIRTDDTRIPADKLEMLLADVKQVAATDGNEKPSLAKLLGLLFQ